MNKIASLIDRTNMILGKAMGWLMLGLVLLVTADVIARYLFNTGAVLVQELEWWMFSIIFLTCGGYTFLYEEHVRVDILYSRMPFRWKKYTDILCAFIFLFPMCALVTITSFWFIEESWNVGEISPDPGGMPAYYVLKAFIPFGFIMLALQGVVHVYRSFMELKGHTFDPPEDSMKVRAKEQIEGMQ